MAAGALWVVKPLLGEKPGWRRTRGGLFRTEVFARYQRSEKALLLALAEVYGQGVSTRNVRAITEELCGHGFSASTVSSITVQLDEELERFMTRPLT